VFKAEAEEPRETLRLIREAELRYSIPNNLLLSIAKVESGIRPYILNAQGKIFAFSTKQEAEEKIVNLVENGVNNIDIGIMQINLRWHGEKFNSFGELLDPATNIDYAARYLASLYKKHETWLKAVRMYHSATPVHHKKYSKTVILSWLELGVNYNGR